MRAMRILTAPFVATLVILLSNSPARAFEDRFLIDESVDLAALERSGEILVRSARDGEIYTADASAVLKVDPARLLAVSTDYDRYDEMGMPNVRESRQVAAGQRYIYTWTHMESGAFVSQHYLEVEVLSRLDAPGSAGARWQLAPYDQIRNHPYDNSPAFSRLDGSWYIQELRPGVVYVRYYLAADVAFAAPDWLISRFVKKHFSEGVRQVIQVLAREAAPGQ